MSVRIGSWLRVVSACLAIACGLAIASHPALSRGQANEIKERLADVGVVAVDIWHASAAQNDATKEAAARAEAAQALLKQGAAEQALAGKDPFSARDGFQSHGTVRRRFELSCNDAPVAAVLAYGRDGLTLQVGQEQAMPLQCTPQGDGLWVRHAERLHSVVHTQGEVAHVFTPRGAAVLELQDPLAHAGEGHREGGRQACDCQETSCQETSGKEDRGSKGSCGQEACSKDCSC